MTMDNEAHIVARNLANIQRVYSLPHNTDLCEAHQKWLNKIQTFTKESSSELIYLIIELIENHQSALNISEFEIHYISPAQQIVNLYRDQPQQRVSLLQQMREIVQLGEPLFESPHVYQRYASQGLSDIIDILLRTQEIWDVQALYHADLALPSELLELIDGYIENLGPYRGLNYDERADLLNDRRVEIVQKYPQEIFDLFMRSIKEEQYFHYWLSKELFFVLMQQKDKRLNRPNLLQQLAENFHLIIKKMIYAKPFILYFIFSIEKLAKANQLTTEIVDAIEPLKFINYVNQSIPQKRLLQIEDKIKIITQQFRAQQ